MAEEIKENTVVTEATKEVKENVVEGNRMKKVFAKCKKVKIVVPEDKLNPKDTFVTASINGHTIQIKRGAEVEIPEPFYKVLKESKYVY